MTRSSDPIPSAGLPDSDRMRRVLGAAAESVIDARGQAERLQNVLDRSPIPMVIADNERLYIEANGPARLMARMSLAQMRSSRIDDLTPPDELPRMRAVWTRMLKTGFVAGPREVAGGNGSMLQIFYWGMANVVPGQHLFAFAPTDWPTDELGGVEAESADLPAVSLTPREREIMQLAAEGLSGPSIAEQLTLSPMTVKTHFHNVYKKLGVSGRPGAVAKGIRLGLIY
jgi:DNA-binding CsgD family transcriptional regulator